MLTACISIHYCSDTYASRLSLQGTSLFGDSIYAMTKQETYQTSGRGEVEQFLTKIARRGALIEAHKHLFTSLFLVCLAVPLNSDSIRSMYSI